MRLKISSAELAKAHSSNPAQENVKLVDDVQSAQKRTKSMVEAD